MPFSLLEKRTTVERQEGRSGSRLAGRSPNRYPDSGRCVPRPKVNVSALFDDHPSAKKSYGAANFISPNRIRMKNNL